MQDIEAEMAGKKDFRAIPGLSWVRSEADLDQLTDEELTAICRAG